MLDTIEETLDAVTVPVHARALSAKSGTIFQHVYVRYGGGIPDADTIALSCISPSTGIHG